MRRSKAGVRGIHIICILETQDYMNISIIIPNYNGVQLLQSNLSSIVAILQLYKKGEKELIIVDDCSQDDSIAFLKGFQQRNKTIPITILTNAKNIGFAPTVNRGVAYAKGDIVILLNTDVVPEKNFLVPLLPHFANPDVFGVGCMDRSIEKGKIVLRGRGIGAWQKGFLIHARGETDAINTLWVSGGSGAFNKKIWDILGGLDSLYAPFYYEDIDISYRAQKSGYSVFFEPKALVKHEHEKGAIKSHYSFEQIKTIAYRNQFIFVWKNMTDKNLIAAHFRWLPYHFLSAVKRKDYTFFKGFFAALLLLVPVLVSRKQVGKLFTKDDSEVISPFIS